jgi:peptidoglycan/xylan/chitin deacetylase (PgdA/CDA1 family)
MPTVTVFFRFDDYSQSSPESVERGLVDALRAAGACATFAVIPAVTEGSYQIPGDRGVLPLGLDKAEFLRRATAEGVIDVALHGWNHRCQAGSARRGEFLQIDRSEQLGRLNRGKARFAELGIETTVFVPPWNAYDSNTLAALHDAQFTCLSANRYGPVATGPLKYLPITVDLNGLRQAIRDARLSGDPDATIGVLLHPYDFEESGDPRAITNCRAFEQELHWLLAQPGIRVRTIGQIARDNQTIDVQRFRANRPLSFESIVPPFTRGTSDTPFFRSTARAQRLRALRALATFATYATAALVSTAIGIVVWRGLETQGPSAALFLRAVLAMSLFALVVRTMRHRAVYFRGMLALSVLGGIFAAAWG